MSGIAALVAAAVVIAELAAATFVAWRLSGAAVGSEGSRTLRVVTGLVVGMTQIIAVQMLCGALDVLYVPVVLSLHGVIGLAVSRRVTPVGRHRNAGPRPGVPGIVLGAVFVFTGILAILLSARTPADP